MSKKKKLSATSITRVMESRNRRSTGAADPRQQRLQESQQKKKNDPMKIRGIVYVDYKDVKILERYINEHGKMLPRRYTGITAAMQRDVERAIRQARHLALLPFVGEGMR